MKLGHPADEIRLDDIKGTTFVYVVMLENRPVMQILCDTGDPNRRIAIAKANGTGFQWTTATFNMKAEDMVALYDTDNQLRDVRVGECVDERSVFKYVLPRLHVMIARLLHPLAD